MVFDLFKLRARSFQDASFWGGPPFSALGIGIEDVGSVIMVSVPTAGFQMRKCPYIEKLCPLNPTLFLQTDQYCCELQEYHEKLFVDPH